MTTKKFKTEDIGINKLEKGRNPKEVTDKEWKEVLPKEVFSVTRKDGTEAPSSGGFNDFFDKGIYNCICCGAQLFRSESKFAAHCGWPAFDKSVDNDLNIVRIVDNSHGMRRVEVRCKQCDAHLGHVFNDGPRETTGERYCINSVCMAFEKNE